MQRTSDERSGRSSLHEGEAVEERFGIAICAGAVADWARHDVLLHPSSVSTTVRQIDLASGIILHCPLQHCARFAVIRKHKTAGSAAVEPMHWMDMSPKLITRTLQQRDAVLALFGELVSVNHYSSRFADDAKIGGLVQYWYEGVSGRRAEQGDGHRSDARQCSFSPEIRSHLAPFWAPPDSRPLKVPRSPQAATNRPTFADQIASP